MSPTLYIRLHREANVPGERCAWILRSRTGGELRRGEDVLDRIPRAGTVIGVLSHDMVLTRTLRLPPGRRARSPTALAGAIEPHLLSDPAANHIVALGDDTTGATVIAAVTRAWLDSCVAALSASGHAPHRLIVESDLVPRIGGAWTALCHADGGLLSTGVHHAELLDACAPGTVPEVLRLQLKATSGAAAPKRLVVFADAASGIDPGRWERELGIDIEPRGAWDWAQATGAGVRPASCADLLPRGGAAADGISLARWCLPLRLAAATLLLHAGASIGWWWQNNAERAALDERIAAAFQRTVGPSEPLVDASVQAGRALTRARRNAGEYAESDFMPLLGRVTALSAAAALPANALKSVRYRPNELSLEWDGASHGAIERIAAELTVQGLRAEAALQGLRSVLTLRSVP